MKYEPPTIEQIAVVDDTELSCHVPTTLAVSVALSAAVAAMHPAISNLLFPCRAKLRWTALPRSVQGAFNSLCEQLKLDHVTTTAVREVLFR